MASYTYTPLPPGKNQIRLVTLLPAMEQNERIAIYLHTTAMGPARKQYEALSYVWGSPDNPETISVITSSRTSSEADGVSSPEYNAAPLLVTQNLATALRHLRRRATARTFWIDAICIDQQNIAEKSEQVGRMAHIYKTSWRVVIWLGPNSSNSDRGMHTVDHLGKALRYDRITGTFTLTEDGADEPHLADPTQPLPDWESLVRDLEELFWRPWFERLWVVQEVLLSPEAMVVCGRMQTRWQYLLLACSFLRTRGHYASPKLTRNTRDRLKRIEIAFPTHARPRLLFQVQATQQHKCADDRDRIYAVLSLAADARKIKPDYSLSTTQVFQELTMVEMNTHFSLRFLKFCELASRRIAGPSWVPDWTAEMDFVSDLKRKDYNVASLAFQRVIQPTQGCIRVTAARVGTVVIVDAVSFPPNATVWDVQGEIASHVPSDVESWTYKTGCSALEAISGTLLEEDFMPRVPGLTDSRFSTPQKAADALRSCLPCKDSPDLPEDREWDHEFLSAVYSHTKNKALVYTEEGHIGLTDSCVEEGDIILAILSCMSFTVVRPAPGNEGRYQVVGNTFLYGFNNQEIFLGPLPENIRAEAHAQRDLNARAVAFRDIKTDQVSWIDPRYEALGISCDLDDDSGMPKYISPEALEKAGIHLSQIDLV